LTADRQAWEGEETALRARIDTREAEKLVLLPENQTLRNDVETLEDLNDELRKWQIDNTTLKTDKAALRAQVERMRDDNKALRKDIRKVTEINQDVLPFMRDHYAVALRTLADGVLYAAGWTGANRDDFMWANGDRLEDLFEHRFARWEITAIVQ
jgi:chromosome segregation ATPase